MTCVIVCTVFANGDAIDFRVDHFGAPIQSLGTMRATMRFQIFLQILW